jgi:heat shock protein HslJ
MSPSLTLVLLAFLGSLAAARQADPLLHNTDWTLTHLQGKPIAVKDGQAAPGLRLATNASRFSGSAGCNKYMGTYVLRGSGISFGPAATTRMTCPAIDLETRYLAALARVKTWRIARQRLELLDERRRVLARFGLMGQAPQESGAPPASFVNKVWTVAKSTAVAQGTLYVFLSEGTLVIASSTGKPSLGKWTRDGGRLTMIEEGIPYRTDILEVRDDLLRIRSHNPGGAVDITLVPAGDAQTDKAVR